MAIYDNLPYANFHELNLDWVVKTVKDVKDKTDDIDQAVDTVTEAKNEVVSLEESTRQLKEDTEEVYENTQTLLSDITQQVSDNTNDIAVHTAEIAAIVSGTTPDANAELIDIRISADGETYPSAGDAVRGQVDTLKTALSYTNVDLLAGIQWMVGTIASSGAIIPHNYTTIYTHDYIDIENVKEINFTVEAGYKFGWHFYDALKAHISSASAYVTTALTLTVPATARYLLINMADTANSAANLSWSEHMTATYNGSLMKKTVKENSSELLAVNSEIDEIRNIEPINVLSGVTWEAGSIDTNGKYASNAYTIRTTAYIDVSAFKLLSFDIDSGYKFGWHFYTAAGAHISSATAYVTTKLDLAVPTTAKYLSINMTTTGSQTADVQWAEHLTCVYKYPLIQELDTHNGNSAYTGEKIHLTESDKVHNFNIELWKAYNSDNTLSIGNYHLTLHQSMTMFGGYVFLLNDSGGIAIADYATKDIISYVTVSPTTNNHQNSAQFSDIYYDDNDEFPLLFISRCGNNTGGSGNDTCLVYRVTRAGTTFTFTLINTIACDITTYGNSWCLDVNNRTLSMVGYVNGTYLITTDNPVTYFTWRLPTAAELLSGNTITLKKEDYIATASIPYALLQSACANGDLVYAGIGSNGLQYVFAMDISKGYLHARIPLTSTKECEGVAVYNNKMYVSHRDYNDPANPLYIYELTF